jgi:3-hydroxyisobutyrate dehydrogenase
MLPDGKAVRAAVLEGRDAAVEGLGAGALVMDMSSSNPVDTQKLARDLAGKGLALLDAPVSGGVKRAVDGSLSIMVGGRQPTSSGRGRCSARWARPSRSAVRPARAMR